MNHKNAKTSPMIKEFILDFLVLTRKYDTPELAKRLGVARQTLDKGVQKKKKGKGVK